MLKFIWSLKCKNSLALFFRNFNSLYLGNYPFSNFQTVPKKFLIFWPKEFDKKLSWILIIHFKKLEPCFYIFIFWYTYKVKLKKKVSIYLQIIHFSIINQTHYISQRCLFLWVAEMIYKKSLNFYIKEKELRSQKVTEIIAFSGQIYKL